MDITVGGNAAGEDLDITATGAATEIRVTTASTVADAFRLNATAGGFDIDGNDTTSSISLTSNGDADDLTIEVLGANDVSLVLSSAGTGADAVDVNATAGGITVDAADSLSVDVTAPTAASNISVASDSAGDDLTVSVTGATDSSLILSSTGTTADALQINTTAGGMDITATANAAGEDLDITAAGATTELRLTSASTELDAIDINASAGGLDFDAVDDINFTLTSGTDAEDFTINLAGATDSSLVLSSTGTAADALTITTTAGGMDISVAGNAAGEDLDVVLTGAATEFRLSTASTVADGHHTQRLRPWFRHRRQRHHLLHLSHLQRRSRRPHHRGPGRQRRISCPLFGGHRRRRH